MRFTPRAIARGCLHLETACWNPGGIVCIFDRVFVCKSVRRRGGHLADRCCRRMDLGQRVIAEVDGADHPG